MTRDIKKAVYEYEKLTNGDSKFYRSDVDQIFELTINNGSMDVYRAVMIALKTGYVVGYRTAKRHIRG